MNRLALSSYRYLTTWYSRLSGTEELQQDYHGSVVHVLLYILMSKPYQLKSQDRPQTYQMLQNCYLKTKHLILEYSKTSLIKVASLTYGKGPQQSPSPNQVKTKTAPSSYRPIAPTLHRGKAFEMIIKNRLNHFCEANNILPLEQSGFRKKCSTMD